MRPSIIVPSIVPNQLFRTLNDVETPNMAQTPSAPKRSFKRENSPAPSNNATPTSMSTPRINKRTSEFAHGGLASRISTLQTYHRNSSTNLFFAGSDSHRESGIYSFNGEGTELTVEMWLFIPNKISSITSTKSENEGDSSPKHKIRTHRGIEVDKDGTFHHWLCCGSTDPNPYGICPIYNEKNSQGVETSGSIRLIENRLHRHIPQSEIKLIQSVSDTPLILKDSDNLLLNRIYSYSKQKPQPIISSWSDSNQSFIIYDCGHRNSDEDIVGFGLVLQDESIHWLNTYTIPTNKWTFVTCTFDGYYMKLFLDGELECQTEIINKFYHININPFDEIYIGGMGGSITESSCFTGFISHVMIWRVCRKKNEIIKDMNIDNPINNHNPLPIIDNEYNLINEFIPGLFDVSYHHNRGNRVGNILWKKFNTSDSLSATINDDSSSMSSLNRLLLAKKLVTKNVVIIFIHCINCEYHNMTTNHIPGQYESTANSIIEEIKKNPLFCKWPIERNPDYIPPRLGQFEIIIKHDDLEERSTRRVTSRIFSQYNLTNKDFPSPEDIVKKLEDYLYSLMTKQSSSKQKVLSNIDNLINEAKPALFNIAQKLYTIENSEEFGKLLLQSDIQNVNYILLTDLVNILKKFDVTLTHREGLLLCKTFQSKEAPVNISYISYKDFYKCYETVRTNLINPSINLTPNSMIYVPRQNITMFRIQWDKINDQKYKDTIHTALYLIGRDRQIYSVSYQHNASITEGISFARLSTNNCDDNMALNEERYILQTDIINPVVFGLIFTISGWKSLTCIHDIKFSGYEWDYKLPPTCTDDNVCFDYENISLLSPSVINSRISKVENLLCNPFLLYHTQVPNVRHPDPTQYVFLSTMYRGYMKHQWTLKTMNNIIYTPDSTDIVERIPALLNDLKCEYKDILYINYCKNCHEHQITTRHVEKEFIDYFNLIKDVVEKQFPNVIVIDSEEMSQYTGKINKHKHHKRLGQFEVHLWRPSSWTNQLIYSACNNNGKLPEMNYILHSLKSIIKTAVLHPIPETNRGVVNIRVLDSVTNKFLPGANIYLYKVELLTSEKLLQCIPLKNYNKSLPDYLNNMDNITELDDDLCDGGDGDNTKEEEELNENSYNYSESLLPDDDWVEWIISPNNIEYRIRLYSIIYFASILSTGMCSRPLLLMLFSNPKNNKKVPIKYQLHISYICSIFRSDNSLLKYFEKLVLPRNYNDAEFYNYIGINWYDLCQAFENSLFRYYHKKCKNGNDLESLRLMHSSNEDNSNRREVTDADGLFSEKIILGTYYGICTAPGYTTEIIHPIKITTSNGEKMTIVPLKPLQYNISITPVVDSGDPLPCDNLEVLLYNINYNIKEIISDIDSSTHKAKFILPKGSYSLIIRTKSSPTNLCKRRECLNVICDNINYKIPVLPPKIIVKIVPVDISNGEMISGCNFQVISNKDNSIIMNSNEEKRTVKGSITEFYELMMGEYTVHCSNETHSGYLLSPLVYDVEFTQRHILYPCFPISQLQEKEMFVTLIWDGFPTDIDLHLTISEKAFSNTSIHIWPGQAKSNFASMLVDYGIKMGPQTIKIQTDESEMYHISAVQFSKGGDLKNSKLKCFIVNKNGIVKIIDINEAEDGDGLYWDICNFTVTEDGEVFFVDVNQICNDISFE